MTYRDRRLDEEMGHSTEAYAALPHVGATEKKRIKLALQGGGAYGAYTAGVVAQLLLDPKIEIVEISGTSAGEKIALIVADRINSAATYDEGRHAAVRALFDFWGRIVRESAPVMHALDVIDQPWKPQSWSRFFTSAAATHSKVGTLPTIFDFWRVMTPDNGFMQNAIDMMEEPWKRLESRAVFGNDGVRRQTANLPALDDMARQHERLADVFETATRAVPWFAPVPRGMDIGMGSLKSATAAVATDALRSIIGEMVTVERDPRDPDDHIVTHAASGKFIKVYINTAMETPEGLKNCVHTGRDITLKRSMGSSALMGFFEPAIIDGKHHWDGGYTENTCLTALLDSPTPCDGVFIVGTNRPVDTTITPRLQRDIPRRELEKTKGLIWHQMYGEAVLHAQNWRPGQPTLHMVTYNHAPEYDWTAKQNTFDWHIRSLIRRGQTDGVAAIADMRPFIGVRPTIDRAELERIAREGGITANLANHARREGVRPPRLNAA